MSGRICGRLRSIWVHPKAVTPGKERNLIERLAITSTKLPELLMGGLISHSGWLG